MAISCRAPCSLPEYFKDQRLREMPVHQTRVQRQRNLTIASSQVKGGGVSLNCIEAAISLCQLRMSNCVVGIQFHRLLILFYRRIELAVVWLLHQGLGRLEGSKSGSRLRSRLCSLTVLQIIV